MFESTAGYNHFQLTLSMANAEKILMRLQGIDTTDPHKCTMQFHEFVSIEYPILIEKVTIRDTREYIENVFKYLKNEIVPSVPLIKLVSVLNEGIDKISHICTAMYIKY